MGKINLVRAVLGGLIAGIVIDLFQVITNGLIIEKQWVEVATGQGRSGALSFNQTFSFSLWGLLVGIVMMLTYAAIRPRLGPGPHAAVFAGVLIWTSACALGSTPPVLLHLVPIDLTAISLVLSLIAFAIAGVIGAYFYKESSSAPW
jgi:hypothetical protein